MSGSDPGSVDPPTHQGPLRPRDPLRWARLLVPLVGFAISVAIILVGLQSGVLDSLASLRSFIDSLGFFGPLIFLLANGASVVFPIIPAGLLVIAAPVLFGPVEGTIFNYISIVPASLLNFLIARRIGLGIVERMFAPRTVERYLGWTRSAHFTRALALAIALPVAPDDLLCYLAGTTRMRWRTFVLIIVLGKPWSLMAYGLGVSALVERVLHW
ncbi:Uncharacterized membrane protein YdjX, TVP38/TMEM64 family, SNARE-associated domain [Raineyella antarctica]|uniref:TVP38/TMEM64 family membrane protein n=1 Tax=Raineyella antarctica TaxID=1577474 RepID=A0A1G6GQT1_9ACTN|nr:VTT domain-containing protein [Raineyella antarctica]SDB83556.1 Uncharacterized membrane protein YdjX, TVP38/TMEM64 family, SNARE-associated domain [Raineyella antarctica]